MTEALKYAVVFERSEDGYGVFVGGLNTVGGAQDIDALVAYLSGGYKAPSAAYDRAATALQLPRVTRLP